MGSASSWRRVRVERGIYLLPNGKFGGLLKLSVAKPSSSRKVWR